MDGHHGVNLLTFNKMSVQMSLSTQNGIAESSCHWLLWTCLPPYRLSTANSKLVSFQYVTDRFASWQACPRAPSLVSNLCPDRKGAAKEGSCTDRKQLVKPFRTSSQDHGILVDAAYLPSIMYRKPQCVSPIKLQGLYIPFAHLSYEARESFRIQRTLEPQKACLFCAKRGVEILDQDRKKGSRATWSFCTWSRALTVRLSFEFTKMTPNSIPHRVM